MKRQIDENGNLTERSVDEMVCWINYKLIKWQVDVTSGWWNVKLMNIKLVKQQFDAMAIWQNCKLTERHINETTSLWSNKLMKQQVDEKAGWWNGRLMKRHVD